MALEVIEPQYRIQRPTMRDLVFAPATERLTWPAAVKACTTKGMLPASAAQVWAFRLEAEGADDANKYFATSTAAAYFMADGTSHVALYDTQQPDGRDNLLITQAQEGYDAHRSTGRWRVSMKDKTLAMMLKNAEARDRIITPTPRTLALNGEYAKDRSTLAILDDASLATDVQHWLREKSYATGYNWLLTTEDLHRLGVNDQFAELRRVGVGGVGDYVNYLDANGRCGSYGRARGVRKNSTGNKG